MTTHYICGNHGTRTTFNSSAVERYLDKALYCVECEDYPTDYTAKPKRWWEFWK